MKFFQGKIGEQGEKDDGQCRLKSVLFDLMESLEVAVARVGHTNPLFSRRIEDVTLIASSVSPAGAACLNLVPVPERLPKFLLMQGRGATPSGDPNPTVAKRKKCEARKNRHP